ncbi:hypothetical protein TanjilG_16173 [Lupinus angustifolius]|uniref:Oxysterol-binding protein n=1 Tax=Lupinus angustifolius TaxID=3871 RepID=A0A1J7H6S4_LUPAN|nr:hypothetical protein TanjilG_16173 [Lupinus angustifolius]
MLSMCNKGHSPQERFISVVAWCISTTRPATFGVAPFNPILGETHHVSKGNLNVLLEQVSHHPPVTALHATDEKENIEMIWSQQPVPKFNGLGGNHKVIKGKIFDSSSLKVLYEVDGHWDSIVKLKDTNNATMKVIYDAKEVISGLKAPIVKDAESVWPTESAYVWGETSQEIMNKNWEKAREAKQVVEEEQRELLRERESKGESWNPKHFTISYSKEEGWDCSPIHKWVLDAPIIAQ